MDDRGSKPRGPFAFENWRAAIAGHPATEALEVPLFTDAIVVGEINGAVGRPDVGPYLFLNTVPSDQRFGALQPAVVARVEKHISEELPELEATDDSRFHGGTLFDELASLLSLCLGARFLAGGIAREFHANADPRGRPVAHYRQPLPSMNPRNPTPVVPRAVGKHTLNDAMLLETLPHLCPRDALALIRAARSYQQGLWTAETEPELAWLFFVTSVETAADHWHSTDPDPVEALREHKRDLVSSLVALGGEEALILVASEFGRTMRATAKFLGFLGAFAPAPPADRPVPWAQLDWSPKAIKKTLTRVYDYRSRHLHAGKPFPAPMCEPPWLLHGWRAHAEVPVGEASATMGGVWKSEDVPINLHSFEYIVRHSLLDWWHSLVPTGG